ncbi:MAG: pilus assembly protein PilZ [Rhodanobacter sp. 68-29]|uniref:PilZ domain-containing protein n=1 Tax=Rhodanobacter sp. PCA2 TaxID=2006117 RepID=UPI00086CB94A|nr:PilZ domain-containing protein [Rhodanobacter sp. PCA2]MBA2078715.1 pilus assembly protein PilZ [Rhodanobacter sp. PCA2]MBN8921717.1 PilZ domain-containing protein [Rhodanobacter sp.]ODU72586.1 MAG: pilus assembly protein PilZ [Rhodanobacter sp. SCN 69-32]OJY61292.1 MAG: pilus assembly protein PilZ [Rhodanobacter sp. 68-29]
MNPVAARQGIISLKIKDAASLYNAYMPFLRNGGLFASTAQPYALGDEVVLLVSLADETERLSVVGKVVWICPPGAQGNRIAGIGIHFNDSSDAEVARQRIENILAGVLNSERPTHTM